MALVWANSLHVQDRSAHRSSEEVASVKNIVKFMCTAGHPASRGTGVYMGSGAPQLKQTRERQAIVPTATFLQAPIADRPTTNPSALTCELRT
jgi:hypothetical protein